ncbi:hypothetical protein [Dyella japonica]|uniref:hypothetical protein n=1 Tax=Dyella japonica TaxID=231455 RepID=UPI0002F6EE07|nr:hypothetical protein [Dyella japonica]
MRILSGFVSVPLIALFALSSIWPLPSKAEEAECNPNWIAPGQRTVTPARITGESKEHLVLHINRDTPLHKDTSTPGADYLISGDPVDLVTTCGDYSYVRFHGQKQVSTGWVDKARVKVEGDPYVPLPPNANALCQAAEDVLNSDHAHGKLPNPPSEELDPEVGRRFDLPGQPAAATPQVAHVISGGRSLAVVTADWGGTCHAFETTVLSGDMTSLLTPKDKADRDPYNTGEEHWGFGNDETLVSVLGQPMIMTAAEGSTSFYLSLVDRNGDLVATCHGELVAQRERSIIASHDDAVCHAMLAGRQEHLNLGKPSPKESFSLSGRLKENFGNPSRGEGDEATQLRFFFLGGTVTYSLDQTGDVDLNNSGHAQRVGIVSYKFGDSQAGCGTAKDSQSFPVYIDAHGVGDPGAPANQDIGDKLPQGLGNAKLSKYAGRTYVELSDGPDNPSAEVWQINAHGPSQVCAFQTTRYVVSPIN